MRPKINFKSKKIFFFPIYSIVVKIKNASHNNEKKKNSDILSINESTEKLRKYYYTR